MRKLISFMHISLDGYVAGSNGEMDWICVNDEIFEHVGKRVSTGDTAVYGRVTYQMMESYWPTAADKPHASKHDIEHSSWYKGIQKIVLSNTLPENAPERTTVLAKNLSDRILELKQVHGENSSDILIFGSPTATHSLMELNLIDGYWLFVNPVILGKGVPLFANIKEKTKLNLLSSHSFACGVTALNYTLANKK